MNTLRLKSLDENTLVTDLKSIFPDWIGETDYCTDVNFQLHFLGTITKFDEDGNPITLSGYHANVLVPDDWVNTFTSEIVDPENPVHYFM